MHARMLTTHTLRLLPTPKSVTLERTMTSCCCGTLLDTKPVEYQMRISPCRCPFPGNGPGQLRGPWTPGWVSKRQYEGRKKLGLPVVTPAERAVTTILKS